MTPLAKLGNVGGEMTMSTTHQHNWLPVRAILTGSLILRYECQCRATRSVAEYKALCPNCGDTGVGLLGVHEWQHPASNEWMEQEEWGSPCPTCGKEA